MNQHARQPQYPVPNSLVRSEPSMGASVSDMRSGFGLFVPPARPATVPPTGKGWIGGKGKGTPPHFILVTTPSPLDSGLLKILDYVVLAGALPPTPMCGPPMGVRELAPKGPKLGQNAK